MRRLLVVAALGLIVAPVAACSNSGEPSTAPTTPAASPTTPAANPDEEVCAEFEAIFDGANFEVIGAAIGEYLVYREAGLEDEATKAEDKIKEQINGMADQVTDLAGRANGAELKAGLGDVATEIRSATDLGFLEDVKSPEQLQGPMTAMLTGWITPVAESCGIS